LHRQLLTSPKLSSHVMQLLAVKKRARTDHSNFSALNLDGLTSARGASKNALVAAYDCHAPKKKLDEACEKNAPKEATACTAPEEVASSETDTSTTASLVGSSVAVDSNAGSAQTPPGDEIPTARSAEFQDSRRMLLLYWEYSDDVKGTAEGASIGCELRGGLVAADRLQTEARDPSPPLAPAPRVPPGVWASRSPSSIEVQTPTAEATLPQPSPSSYAAQLAALNALKSPSRSRVDDLRRTVQSLLNKLCPETLCQIAEKIAAVEVTSSEDLEIVIDLIFKKSLAEPHYVESYADLICILKSSFPDFPSNDGGKPTTFKASVLTICQLEFEALPDSAELTEEERFGLDPEEIDARTYKRKSRMLANMKLVGNLFLRGLLPAKVIGSVIRELLLCCADANEDEYPGEHTVECACELLMCTGHTLESMAMGKNAMQQFSGRLLELKRLSTSSGQSVYSKRIMFLIQDVLDARAAGWKKKVIKSRAKTLDEIRMGVSDEYEIVGQRPSHLLLSFGA